GVNVDAMLQTIPPLAVAEASTVEVE
ncbi:MAG: hypothetical protein QOE32_4234, partial [Pseudonocardiales bacterium]|nr:hypothetical protein [Pseudonocardiales bacterium]